MQVYLWPFDLESGVWVTCDVGYLYANFSFPRPLWSRLRPDVRDRQTSDRQTDRQTSDIRRTSSLNTPTLWGRGIKTYIHLWHYFYRMFILPTVQNTTIWIRGVRVEHFSYPTRTRIRWCLPVPVPDPCRKLLPDPTRPAGIPVPVAYP